jgi:hypothetical protein
VIALHAWAARGIAVPAVDGMRDVVAFVIDEAPTERVLYQGAYDGTFTFYLRAQDPTFRRAVVRGSKLLYASATMPRWRLTERVASVADVLAALHTQCGCGWVIIERERAEDEITAVRYLREALQGPQFRLVRSFPLRAPAAAHIDVYQFLGYFETPAEVTLPFPVLGETVVYRARPIER